MTTKTPRGQIPPSLSVFLDLTRVALSLMVAVGHWTQNHFQDTWPDLSRFGAASVGGFFVLSGFTIRMIYPAREHFAFTSYVAERWSRILAVTIPALLLTAVLDTISWRADTAYYIVNWSGFLDHPGWRLLVNLLGLSQVWGQDISPLSNSPFWSISYELGFYLVYGMWLGGHRLMAAACLVALGPQIALALPLWLLGVVGYEVCFSQRRANAQPWQTVAIAAVLAAGGLLMAAACALFGPQVRSALGAMGLHLIRANVSVILGTASFFSVFILAALASTRTRLTPSSRFKALARWLGNMTFPVYLFHFPMYVFLGALHLYDRHSTLQRVTAFVIVLGLIALITPALDRFKVWLRGAMSWALRLHSRAGVSGDLTT